jgi:hypothetical protein
MVRVGHDPRNVIIATQACSTREIWQAMEH